MKTIDALGIECPMPVIMAKRVIKEGEDNFLVLVDNEVATENLSKMAKQTGFDVDIKKVDDEKYEVVFTKTTNKETSKEKEDAYVVVFDSNKLGHGEEEFSKKLIESFLLALTEQDKYPEYVICYNKGVELTTIVDNAVEDLEKLTNAGVEVLSCGLCLDNYHLKDKLRVGEITNMYRICELMTQFKVVRP
ncbi:sulfurtransferase-like selenium metabolism protein YedF [Neofamilia massiliensis]|uniref:sulfurtransferase-like selenium metabolism protein YedF n=1 Tax=Neofamilia massiliensis TaxID=1673724 RepID=UPI0006BB853F|nr:sulfurtransferase-like selenium metabolism protein YedF [Neofamilia massiliensis]